MRAEEGPAGIQAIGFGRDATSGTEATCTRVEQAVFLEAAFATEFARGPSGTSQVTLVGIMYASLDRLAYLTRGAIRIGIASATGALRMVVAGTTPSKTVRTPRATILAIAGACHAVGVAPVGVIQFARTASEHAV